MSELAGNRSESNHQHSEPEKAPLFQTTPTFEYNRTVITATAESHRLDGKSKDKGKMHTVELGCDSRLKAQCDIQTSQDYHMVIERALFKRPREPTDYEVMKRTKKRSFKKIDR